MSLGLRSGQLTLMMYSALDGMSPAFSAFGFIASRAMMKQKTKAISMLNNMS